MNKKTLALVIVIVVLIAVIAGGAVYIFAIKNSNDTPENNESREKIGMEVGVITNEEDAANYKSTPTSFATYYQRDIYVSNGHEATCFIGNSSSNKEDIYLQIFLNEESGEAGDELYLSKLIPPGSHIESFSMEKDLAPGEYQGTLVHAKVTENGEITSNFSVVVDIHVSD